MAKIRHFLSNVPDPDTAPLGRFVTVGDETTMEARRRVRRWIADKIIGLPQPTATVTVVQMQGMQMVGIYVEIEEGEPFEPEKYFEEDDEES